MKSNMRTEQKKPDGLNVLMIGNSFSEDTVRWTYDIAKALGIEDVNICNLYIGGCSLDRHCQNAVNNTASYDFQVYKDGNWEHNAGKTLLYGIRYYNWDFISLQQASGYSGIESSYGNLRWLMNYVGQNATNPNVKMIWNMTWAYAKNSTHSDFSKYGNDQTNMYRAIVNCVETQVIPANVYQVIPNGTAIQNARTSTVGDTLTRDGYHLSYDLGRYIAGLNLVYTLTGADISNLEYAPDGVSEACRKIATESVRNASQNPYAVTESVYR